jgi:2-polyprenyl-3-methyl-5-hydroxy-6-metoxy-1,4-benzoquinol methylase
MMSDKPVASDAYETLAEAYAAVIETKPHNAYCERPATLSLLPDVKNKRVLDARRGPGIYSEWLIKHGAEVVAVDASLKMVKLAKQRLGGAAEVRQADARHSGLFEMRFCALLMPSFRR